MANILCPNCKKTNDSKNYSCKTCMSNLILKNKYYLLKILDEKSTITYLAYNKKLKEKVIIKEFSLVKAEKWDNHDLFKKEGDILAQLNFHAIPKFIEDFETGIGEELKSYIVMEYIDGISLREEQRKNRYTEEEVIEDILEITKILNYLHNLIPPIIHQDLNLSNIMRRQNGSLALIDFNAVQDIVIKERNSSIKGSYGFIAPEQLMGKTLPASDYYALGVVIIVLLTKKEPEEMLDENNTLQWKEYLHASDRIIQLINGLLIKNPENRIQTLEKIEEILLNKKTIKKQIAKNSEPIAKLRVLSGIKIQDFEIKISPVTIGRTQGENGIRINHHSLSKKHCTIIQTSKKEFKITDLASSNGTYINGQRISSGKAYPLYFNDKIKIGDINLKLISKNYFPVDDKSKFISNTSGYKHSLIKKRNNTIAITAILIFLPVIIYLLYKTQSKPNFKDKKIQNLNNNLPVKIKKKINKKLTVQELYLIGKKYQNKKDYKKANIHFLKACKNNNIKSCEFIAWNYENGLGIKTDIEKSMKYYKIACDNNSGYSCNKRGYIIDTKLGNNYINKLYTARSFFKKSCDLKFGLGCKNLGDFYLKGRGVTKSRKIAKRYFRKACKYGYKKACK